jgi:hypothetical protein
MYFLYSGLKAKLHPALLQISGGIGLGFVRETIQQGATAVHQHNLRLLDINVHELSLRETPQRIPEGACHLGARSSATYDHEMQSAFVLERGIAVRQLQDRKDT